jgi:hypothetical protein
MIQLRTDRRLSLGECGIESRIIDGAGGEAPVVRREAHATAPVLSGEVLPGAYLDIGGRQVAIGAAGAVIGRSPDCDVVIAVGEVSRRHAEVVPDGEGWLVSDLGSTNGVRLNGRQIGVPTRLADGDVIELGSVELIFEVR